MEYFIAITPPKEQGEEIRQFQKRWPSNRLPDLVEPHITVKSQAGLSDDEIWLGSVKAMCESFPIFGVSIKSVNSFGASVVYLGIESKKIKELHSKIVRAVSPDPEASMKYFELDLYEPHLTLGAKEYGMSEIELSEMKKIANNCLHDFQPFVVNSLRVYKLLENKYQKIHEIDLKQTGSERIC
jgi:2'-5' RNA ligase